MTRRVGLLSEVPVRRLGDARMMFVPSLCPAMSVKLTTVGLTAKYGARLECCTRNYHDTQGQMPPDSALR
jgi:hypothetical protein